MVSAPPVSSGSRFYRARARGGRAQIQLGPPAMTGGRLCWSGGSRPKRAPPGPHHGRPTWGRGFSRRMLASCWGEPLASLASDTFVGPKIHKALDWRRPSRLKRRRALTRAWQASRKWPEAPPKQPMAPGEDCRSAKAGANRRPSEPLESRQRRTMITRGAIIPLLLLVVVVVDVVGAFAAVIIMKCPVGPGARLPLAAIIAAHCVAAAGGARVAPVFLCAGARARARCFLPAAAAARHQQHWLGGSFPAAHFVISASRHRQRDEPRAERSAMASCSALAGRKWAGLRGQLARPSRWASSSGVVALGIGGRRSATMGAGRVLLLLPVLVSATV